jgi:hypothetical protein
VGLIGMPLEDVIKANKPKTAKEELLSFVQSLPDNIDVFMTKENQHNDIDIKIFTQPKGEDFYDWYFLP